MTIEQELVGLIRGDDPVELEITSECVGRRLWRWSHHTLITEDDVGGKAVASKTDKGWTMTLFRQNVCENIVIHVSVDGDSVRTRREW